MAHFRGGGTQKKRPPVVEAHPAFSVVHAADGLHGCGGGHSSPGRLEADRASAGVDN